MAASALGISPIVRSLLKLADGAEDGAHVFHGHAVLHHVRHAKYVPALGWRVWRMSTPVST
jgi:hypothetical protein